MKEKFHYLAQRISNMVGSPIAFAIASFIIILWALAGPIFHYSDTWQLIINTSTTIITFLMVFLIQNSQNRDSRAVHLKLDELIRATTDARDKLINLENLTDQELDELHAEFCRDQKIAQDSLKQIETEKNRKP